MEKMIRSMLAKQLLGVIDAADGHTQGDAASHED
jgi:hypothetical protein